MSDECPTNWKDKLYFDDKPGCTEVVTCVIGLRVGPTASMRSTS
jgi:hypothetical protein